MAEITLRMEEGDARVLWHAVSTVVQLLDTVGDISRDAPLYGQRDRLVKLAQEVDHRVNHAECGCEPGELREDCQHR